jgi:hypothetical protein
MVLGRRIRMNLFFVEEYEQRLGMKRTEKDKESEREKEH